MRRLLPIIAVLLPGLAAAQSSDLRLPISLDAESTDYDGKSSMLMFRGLRLTQGRIGIEAEEGRASKLDFQDSVWHFEGNVVIDVEDGHIESDSADLAFSDHTLKLATITGSPATFELRRPGSDEVTYAEARKLSYDLDSGVVEFSGDAVITEGGNKIASSYLVYNIRERRIKAQSAAGDERVRITYTPSNPPPDETAGDADPTPGDGDEAP
ncbi:MAG: LptA/OstA family protein [Woeseiaceae bacterium]|nr:LptA/OstA family protein [Woeseiaceae bacterium]